MMRILSKSVKKKLLHNNVKKEADGHDNGRDVIMLAVQNNI
jgi:hypothetical protein